jgi:sugar lactone lactonase YvrE
VGRDASRQTAVFSAANAGLPLGDVAQSMSDDATAYWLVVNNSATVHRLNREDLRSEATIDVQASPRYVQSTADGQAVLVTDLFAGRVAVCDREGNFLRSLSANGGWTERMLKAEDNRIWVADMTNNRLRIADPMAMGWVDSVATGTEPEGLVQDADGRIWALCTGGFVDPEPRLQAFEANGTAFFDEALDTAASYPTSLSLSPDGRTLYWLSSQGVHRMAVDAATPPTGAWIPSAGANWYALGCDPKSGILYVADAVDFASAGQVSRYTAEGTLLDAFETGINPGHFFFTE